MIMATQHPKVLVIDDELGPRESLRILLKTEFEMHLADGVRRGLELLQQHKPDVVIMDIRMPGLSGIEGLREIRRLDPDVAVVMLTGFGALETAQEALRMGASDYLKKPFDTKEIVEVVRHQVRRTAQNRRRSAMEKQLEELTGQLSGEMARKDRMSSLGEASAELVHDLRNPLTVVQGYVQMLNEDLLQNREKSHAAGDSTGEYLNAIESGVKRCRELIDAWQDLGRKTVHDLVPTNPVAMITEVVESQRRLAANKHAALALTVETTDSLILCDTMQLSRALQNIVGNATEALPETGGSVHILFRRIGEEVVITVRDDGMGISPENLTRLFKPYFTTKGRNRGTGLGLFITRKIIEDHRGRIEINSFPGEGTTVDIHLPLHRSSLAPTPA